MQVQVFGALKKVVSPPSFAEAVGARHHQPVQHSEKNGTLNIEFKPAILQQALNGFADTSLFPQSLKDDWRTDLYSFGRDITFPGQEHHGPLGEPGQGTDQCLHPAFGLHPVQTADGSDNALFYFPFLFTVFDDLKILVFSGFFDACKQGSLLFVRHSLYSNLSAAMSIIIAFFCGTTF